MVHLELLRPLAVEVEVSDRLAQGVTTWTRMSGFSSSIISRASICSRSSTLCSARSGARSTRGHCRIWIYAMRRRRARCISHGKGP
jgi:hypothetical protein